MNKELTTAQLDALKPFVKQYLGPAYRSRVAPYPGQAAIDKMLAIWEDFTGSRYPFRAGCGECLMNLLIDFATLYFAARPKENVAESKTYYFDVNGNEHKSAAEAAAVSRKAEGKPAKPAKKPAPKKK